MQNRKDNKPFDSYDQEILMTLGEQAVIGIRNLQLYEEQQKIILGSIKSLVTLFDTRVPCAYTHSPYFSRLVCAIGRRCIWMRKNSEPEIRQFASRRRESGYTYRDSHQIQPAYRERAFYHQRPSGKGAKILRHLEAIRPAIPIILHHHRKI